MAQLPGVFDPKIYLWCKNGMYDASYLSSLLLLHHSWAMFGRMRDLCLSHYLIMMVADVMFPGYIMFSLVHIGIHVFNNFNNDDLFVQECNKVNY